MSEEKEYVLRASIDNVVDQSDSFKAVDPFSKSWTELKSYSGLDNNFKRRTSRLIDKADNNPTQGYLDSARAEQHGLGDAKSKEINPGTVYRNGYGLFDVITPDANRIN